VGRSDRTVDRRAALRTLAGGAVGAATSAAWVETLGALAFQQAHSHATDAAILAQDWTPRRLNARQNEAVIVVTELIIPETDTPGAKAAKVNRFVDAVLEQAATADRDRFVQGLAWMDARSKALFGKELLEASPAQQTELLTRLSSEGNKYGEDRIGLQFFEALKTMTINGYYTTEIGLRQELGDNGQLFLPQFQGCDHPDHL
jgi:hypothetical protein